MKNVLIAVVTLIALSIPVLSSAATVRPGPYFSAFIGTSIARDVTVSGTDFNGPPLDFSDNVKFDPGIYTGGTGGFDFGFIRLEGELSYRYANIDTITSPSLNLRSVDGNVGAFATMFNVFFDLHNPTPVTPYLGGGIGFATLHISDTWVSNTGGGRALIYDEGNDTVFASQVGAGVDIALNSRYSLDLGYRYFMTERANFDGDFVSSSLKFESHNAMAGFKFKF